VRKERERKEEKNVGEKRPSYLNKDQLKGQHVIPLLSVHPTFVCSIVFTDIAALASVSASVSVGIVLTP
jgi:hypothetical protein